MNKVLLDKTILVVEDDKLSNENITYMLKEYFKDVISCYNGSEAYKKYLQYSPDIVLTDIELPSMNGLELSKKIRQHNLSLPIIIMTSYTHKDYLLKAVNLQLLSFIVKPITKLNFQEMLKQVQIHFTQNSSKPFYFTNNVCYDFQKKLIINDSQSISLSNQEIDILEEFIKNKNNLLSSEYFKEKFDLNSNALNLLISRLRKKLPAKTIQTIYSQGYRLNHEH